MGQQAGQIAIAGGGIGGLALAVGLQRLGLDVVVFERQPEIRDTGSGISLWPNALAALDVLDLGTEVRGVGRSISRGGERKHNGRRGPSFSTKGFTRTLGDALVCVDRGELVRVLSGLLAPGVVRTGSVVTGCHHKSTSVTVRVEGQGEVEASALIGADGINSVVASQMNGGLEFAYSGYTAWRGIAEMEFEPDRDQIRACLARGHEFGWMPVGRERTYWFATAWLSERHELKTGEKEYLTESFRRWPQPIPELLNHTPADRLVRNDIVDRAHLKRWWEGPIAVLGDAAHPMRPHLGQGGCQALEDAAALVHLLDGRGDTAEAFVRYERARWPRTQRIVGISKHSGFTRPLGPATSLFDRMTTAMPAISVDEALRALKPIAGYSAGIRAATPTKASR
jgi:2-polyprenyl-6-methoxyphenol hydroxylase-like FAD-dependent oxidoreductase